MPLPRRENKDHAVIEIFGNEIPCKYNPECTIQGGAIKIGDEWVDTIRFHSSDGRILEVTTGDPSEDWEGALQDSFGSAYIFSLEIDLPGRLEKWGYEYGTAEWY